MALTKQEAGQFIIAVGIVIFSLHQITEIIRYLCRHCLIL